MVWKICLVISAAAIVVTDKLFPVFGQSYSFWLIPLLFIGIFVALYVIQLAVFVLMILFTDIKKPPKGEKLFRFLLKNLLPIVIKLAKVEIHADGLTLLPDSKNMLFVCNHQHDFDPIIMFSAFPDSKISFIGKEDILEEMKFIAKAMHLISCLFIDRENDRKAAKTVISAIKYLKSGERSIGLFPEGYCSKDGELQPLRNGSLKIALKSGVPIAICAVNNTKQIPKNMFRRKTVIKFRLIEVIEADFYQNMTTAQLGDYIHGKMAEALKEFKG